MDQNDIKNLPRNDQILLGVGILAFIASFFPFWGVSYSGPEAGLLGGSGSSSVSAWHSYGTLGVLLIIAATALSAVLVFGRSSLPEIPVSWNVVLVGLSALGTILIILRGFTYDSGSIGPLDYGLRWGAYVLMILCLAQTALAFLRFRATGEPMPWASQGGAATPPAAPPA
ncbi:MAG: hypothetical protein QOJ03_1387 [Frankiaceae bacterium]|nr:hypothetical protein [Frankiaceae bacterium]